jgi:hypothetical protein
MSHPKGFATGSEANEAGLLIGSALNPLTGLEFDLTVANGRMKSGVPKIDCRQVFHGFILD